MRRGGAASASGGGRAGECGLVEDFRTHRSINSYDKYRDKSGGYLAVGQEVHFAPMLDERPEHKASYVPSSHGAARGKDFATATGYVESWQVVRVRAGPENRSKVYFIRAAVDLRECQENPS